MEKSTILIIDDDQNLRKTLADILQVKGYAVLAARNGTDGLGALRDNKVDLTLIDLDLPDISGLDLLSRIRAEYPSTSAIVLTGNATLESAREATRRGAFSYLVKPYEIEQLMLQIDRAIEKLRMDEALRESEAKFRGLLESAPDGMLIVNERQEIVMVNKQFEILFGYDRGEVVGRQLAMLIPARFIRHREHHDEYLRNPNKRHMGQGRDLVALRKDGSEFPVEISLSPLDTPEGVIVSAAIRDVTERKRYEAQLEYQANYDELTGLSNRNLLLDRLKQALPYAERHGREVAVLFINLDHFKFVNDSLGHNVGDGLLKVVAERLATCVRPDDTVARQGGDDFIIVLADLATGQDSVLVAQKIQNAVSQPLDLEGHDLKVSCSIGISIHPKDGKDIQTLLKNAELAMFRAKEHGRGIFQFFTDELHDRVVGRMTMERSLRRALKNDELSLHYQPQLELATGRVIGVEALLRWQSPDVGSVSPATFIPLAEETGLIIPIGEWVLATACRQNRLWQDAGFAPLVMAVNLSPRQFGDPGLIHTIAGVIRDSGIKSHYLELEITEGMVMRDVETSMAMLSDLKRLGAQLAMDDFGTGYSSLSHLKRFPFDKLKMDISFVREVTYDPGSAAIAKTIIAMAHNLELKVIAEGVETEGQLNFLRTHRCDEMQGFYFSRPLSAGDFEQLLRERRRLIFPEGGSHHSEKTLLLVDDESPVIQLLSRVLKVDGYRILSTTDPRQGFELLATNRVNVVLCDLRMPGMSGSEFLGKISRLYPATVRIAISGYADMAMVTEAINQGAIYKFLTKPFTNTVLRQVIASAFEKFELESGEN
jgi:diguanylate cyclase (GGDEF)-like protein/PAS domain S-box-containing protein